eukprot:TRINITY_DN12090_c1_g1_i1.p3 TRINITY_DN12090_c1_g1~~TRINITY_DN12090_c1_g1_i1.p3  ORF type:complete len:259 (+),score=16.83 TRINITY_DN12090_c1_g1_i1:36-779(+)
MVCPVNSTRSDGETFTLTVPHPSPEQPQRYLIQLLLYMYDILWLLPGYVIILCMNTFWFLQLARAAYASIHNEEASKKPSQRGGTMVVAEEVVRFAIVTGFYIEVVIVKMLLSWIGSGWIGQVIYAILLSWVYSYFLFDFRWALEGKPLYVRLAIFHKGWPFFCGFGSVIAVISSLLGQYYSVFYDAGSAYALIPFFILTAISCDQTLYMKGDVGQLPIFSMAHVPIDWAIKILTKRVQQNQRTKQQ